jgi:hypothetical protein
MKEIITFYFRNIYQNILFIIKYKSKIKSINKKIINNKKQNIIPVIIDCELSTLNQYLEPVIESLVKIPEQLFEFYYGETIKGAGSSYIKYNKKNTFPVEIYQYLKGNMVFLSPHIYPKGPPTALKIVLDHVICNVKFSHHPKNFYTNYDIYCVTGKLNEEKIINTLDKFMLSDKIKVINIGYPKSDKLFQGYFKKEEVISKIKLDPNKKTILYAPSWEEGLSLREFGVSLIDVILKNNEFNLIIKPHPCSLVSIKDKSYKFYTGGINWEEKLSKFNKIQNCIFVKNLKIDELLIISDIMITDISTVALEFIVLNKPVIYLDCPKFEETFKTVYKEFNDISYSDFIKNSSCNTGRHVGLINYDYNKILDDINFIINNPDYKKNERNDFSQSLLSNKGNASIVCANMILENYKEKYNKKEK